MVDHVAPLLLAGMQPAYNHFDSAKNHTKHILSRSSGRYHDDYSSDDFEPTPEERGLVLRKRSEVRSDEEIVERVPRQFQQQMVRRRPGMERRTSSVDRSQYDTKSRGGRDERKGGRSKSRGGRYSDSEGSVPPRSRAGRKRGKSKSNRNRGRSSSSSSKKSSSDLGSSTDDEMKEKKMRHKKWLTAGLASVATVHAVAKLHSSMEAHDKRILAVHTGELSPEEAKKKRRASQWQDAASLAIAALGIKGTISELKELREAQKEHVEVIEQREERHRKRVERQKARRREYWEAVRAEEEEQRRNQRERRRTIAY